MKMVISQLEGILIELKDVAKELREVRLKVSLHISGFLGWGQGGEGDGGMGENVGARWVCFSSRVHSIKCEIPLAAWRF